MIYSILINTEYKTSTLIELAKSDKIKAKLIDSIPLLTLCLFFIKTEANILKILIP